MWSKSWKQKKHSPVYRKRRIAGGSFGIVAEQRKEAEMEPKKTRGAWVIRVRGACAERDADIEHDKGSPSSSESVPHCNEQKNPTDEREE